MSSVKHCQWNKRPRRQPISANCAILLETTQCHHTAIFCYIPLRFCRQSVVLSSRSCFFLTTTNKNMVSSKQPFPIKFSKTSHLYLIWMTLIKFKCGCMFACTISLISELLWKYCASKSCIRHNFIRGTTLKRLRRCLCLTVIFRIWKISLYVFAY